MIAIIIPVLTGRKLDSVSNLFKPGFRLSSLDILVIIVGSVAALSLYFIMPIACFIILFVLSHFFLFCNIIRMSRLPELIWSSVFLLLAGSTVLVEQPGWLITYIASFLVTIILVMIEIKKASYHGIYWKKFNPSLPQWFAQQSQDKVIANGNTTTRHQSNEH